MRQSKKLYTLTLVVIFMAMFPFNLFGEESFEQLWEKVEKAKAEGLPQSAIKCIEPIYEKAIKEEEPAQAVKAVCETIVLEGEIQGNKPEEKIIRLEKEIKKSNPDIKPMLSIILAKWYYHYFSRNRYRFIRRSTTEGLEEKDFTTWDLPKLFKHIGELYENVLASEKELVGVPISKFNGFLEKGNQPVELRSNLFEFFVHDALEFYSCNDQTTARPKDAFELDADSKAFAEVSEFIVWEPETTDKDSSVYKVLKLYQRLLNLNKATNNINALLDNDLLRLEWAYKNAVGEEKHDNYRNALRRIAEAYPNNEYSAKALYLLASIYKDKGDFVTAMKYAKEASSKWPESYGGVMAKRIISDIEYPSISYGTEKILTQENLKIRVNYRNLDHAYFKIFKRKESEILNNKEGGHDYFGRVDAERLAKEKGDLEFDVSLEPSEDYKVKSVNIDLPKLEKGYYSILSSARKEFEFDNNAINLGSIIVSDLAVVTRTDDESNKSIVFVIDSKTGKPISGADVKLYEHIYKKGYSEFYSGKSDKEGKVTLKTPNKRGLLVASLNGDKIYDDFNFYENKNSRNSMCDVQLYFFTDRAIYRPGQTIYFKAIAISYDQSANKYEVWPDRKLVISLRDPNNKDVSQQELVTNEFGSVTGTFIAPTDRLTGSYSLYCSSIYSVSRIRVEEYKRPKFKVQIDDPKEAYQLGKTVNLKGKAMAYTGAVVDGAEVKYRVIRECRLPYWMWWVNCRSNSQEIVNGTVKTNENGEFTIDFVAKPDRSVAKENSPIFTYTVSADVTDSTGETRSASQRVCLGYNALELSIGCGDNINAGSDTKITLFTSTLDGNPTEASGKITVYSLIQPEKPERQGYSFGSVSDNRNAIHNLKEGNAIKELTFTSEDGKYAFELKFNEGIYRIKAEAKDRYGNPVEVSKDIVCYDYESDKMTVKLPFIYQSVTRDVQPGDTYKAFWATGYDDGPAYVEILHRRKILKSFWTDAKKNKQFITFDVTEAMRGGFIVKVFQIKENKFYEHYEHVNVSWINKNLNLKLVHFTSKMEPGSKESWKLQISGKEAEMASIEMLASMYDASLDAYASQYWPLISVFYHDSSNIYNNFSNSSYGLSSMYNSFYREYYSKYVTYPSFPEEVITNYYGFENILCCESAPRMMKGLGAARAGNAPMMLARSVNAVEMVDECAAEPCLDSAEDNVEASANKTAGSSDGESAKENGADVDLSKVTARTNLNETAFFQPQLTVNEDGTVTIDFDMPEALTTWKFMAFAHSKSLQSGALSQEVVTQKELMVQPNAPRFLREGDKLAFTVKVTNLSDKEQTGAVALELLDAITDESRNAEFNNTECKKEFSIPAGQSKGFSWTLNVPMKPGFVKYKAVGASSTNSDGEEGLLPILSSRIMVTESLPLPIRGPETKDFKFEKLLKSGESNTLENKGLTVEVTSNPAWYAVQALPYLIEFPHECSEQTFNRIYANLLASHIANSDPKIRKVFDVWAKDEQFNKGTALKSNMEKNQHLKSVTLMETPWILDAENETEQKHNIGVLFQQDRLDREIEAATNKLKQMQLANGAFSWFPGGYENPFITNYIMTGYGRLRHLGVKTDMGIALKAIDYLDAEIKRIYEKLIENKNYKDWTNIDSTIALYLYGRSFFLDIKPIPSSSKKAIDFYLDEAKNKWLSVPYRMAQAHIALALNRFGDTKVPQAIVKSLMERSVNEEEMGRYWRENELSFSWFRADIETQAMMIELFSEVAKDEQTVDDCKVWLLKQKQTQNWKTTKSTADAVYSLLLKGSDLLASDKLVTVSLAGNEIKPEKVEAGTGYYEKIYSGAEVKPEMGNIQLKKEDKGVAWGALHWQYIEDMSKVTPHENNLKLKKTLFVKENTDKGPVIRPVENGKLRVGDLVVVRIELRTDRDMEFVHMKDQRGSGMEPVNVISRYKYQDGLGYYEATKDSASHFYIDYLPKGTYVFEYELRVQLAGEYQTGIAEIMCMYAPEFNSHSESFNLNVEPQN